MIQYLIAHPQYYPLPNHVATDSLDQNDLQGPTNAFVTNDQGEIKIEYDPPAPQQFVEFTYQGTGETTTAPMIYPSGAAEPSA